MRDIDYVESAYFAADADMALQEINSTSQVDQEHWQLVRYVNDSTYYVSVFAQFEHAVRARVSNLIPNRRTSGSWPDRAAWDVLKSDNLPFMEQVALLFEKGKEEYNEIYEFYKERNTVAHGDFLKTSVFVPGFIKRLVQLEQSFPK
jgi:hypothetical protein